MRTHFISTQPQRLFCSALLVVAFVPWGQFAGAVTPTEPPPAYQPVQPLPTYQTVVNGGYQVMSGLELSTVTSGEPIIADFIVKNIGQKKIHYLLRSYEDIFKFTVRDAQGNDVPLTNYGKRKLWQDSHFWSGSMPGDELKPGESGKFRLLISQMYDMSIPGIYVINSQFVPHYLMPPLQNHLPRKGDPLSAALFAVVCKPMKVQINSFQPEAVAGDMKNVDPAVTSAH